MDDRQYHLHYYSNWDVHSEDMNIIGSQAQMISPQRVTCLPDFGMVI